MIIDQTKTSPSRLLGAADLMRIGVEDSLSLFDSRVAVSAPGSLPSCTGFTLECETQTNMRDRKSPIQEEDVELIRRELLHLTGIVVTAPLMSKVAWAQGQAGPQLIQILRKDLEGQGQAVQETVGSVVDFGPNTAAPWHMHPGAQELLHVIEGSLVVEIEGAGKASLKAGEARIITADLVHLARNESISTMAKALVVHSRAAKDKPLMVVVNK